MESPFVFLREVLNDNFVGRPNELSSLALSLSNKEHMVLMAPNGYGIKSLVHNAFIQAKKRIDIKICICNLFNVRDEYAFYSLLVHELFKGACATADEWIVLAEQLLPLTQPTIKINEKEQNKIQLIFNKQRLQEHVGEVLQLAERIAVQQNLSLVVWINDFHKINDFENSENFQKRLLSQWKQQTQVGYLLSGSKMNAMRGLFAEKKAFHKFGKILPIEPIDQKLFVDYIIKLFSKSGRIISTEHAGAICQITRCYPLYVQQLAHLCWHSSTGFVTDTILNNAVENLLNYNERLFRLLVNSFSAQQLNYLCAVINNVDRFSSSETIEKYQLHSSANIMRVRGALEKKEIIHFVRNKPQFMDPLFELWLRKRYYILA